MATNFTRKQGEVWRTTIEMFDSKKCAIKLADVGASGPTNHSAFFLGVATKKATVGGALISVPISFKLKPAETVESGRGTNRMKEFGYFKVEAFISSDNVGTSGSEDAAVNSTLEMEAGDWTYVIRYSDSMTPDSDHNVRVIVEGTLTIVEKVDVSLVATTMYTAPTE